MTPLALPLPPLPVLGWDSFTGARHAGTPSLLDDPSLLYTSSGRASLLLAMEALGVAPGVRVLVPTYHCPSVVAPVTQLGGEPVFYPIDDTGAPDLVWLGRADTSGVRAIVVAHLFGLPQPMRVIREWCDARGVSLVEDCAHALFGRTDGRPIGTWGDFAIGSLPKFLPVPEGGCLVSQRMAVPPKLAPCPPVAHLKTGLNVIEAGARQRRFAGLNTVVCSLLDGLQRLRADEQRDTADDTPLLAPLPPELDGDFEVDSALAHRRPSAPTRWIADGLPRGRIVARRRRFYAALLQRLNGIDGMRPLRPELPPDCAPYVFPLWVDQPEPGYAELRRHRIPVFRWDRIWPGTPVIEGGHGLAWSHHVLQLSCHQDFDDTALQRYADTLVAVLAPRSAMPARDSTRPA